MGSKRIAPEIKEEALNKVRAGRTVKEVAAEYGFDSKNIYNWLSRSSNGSDKQTLELSRMKRENEALLALVGRLTYEQELAKKRSS